jgi:LmbE family N-acetylglucosaminyl deacetylase
MTEVLATLKANWELIAFFAGLLLSGYRLFKRASKRMLHQTVLEQIKPAQEEMLAAMAAMSEQFKNNGGSSMRDAPPPAPEARREAPR